MMGPKPRSRWERQELSPSGSMVHGGKPSPGDTLACSAWAPLEGPPSLAMGGRDIFPARWTSVVHPSQDG